MLIAYIILLTATLLVVGAIWCAYETGKRVGEYETRRDYHRANWRVNPSNQPTESRK
jgi:hypothetical protein